MPTIVSHSEVETYLLCTRRHWYSFGEKIQKKDMSISLKRGIEGHAFLASFFEARQRGCNWAESLEALDRKFAEEMTRVTLEGNADALKLIQQLMPLINEFLNYKRSEIEPWKIMGVEKEFRVPLSDEITYAFTVDLLIWAEGGYQPVDWKFTYDFYSEDMINLLPQIPKYIGALQMLGVAASKGKYGILRYRSLKNNEPRNLFKLQPMKPTSARMRATWAEYMKVAKKIAAKKAGDRDEWLDDTERVFNQLVCKSCAHAFLCGVELNGSDGKNVRSSLYVPSTYGYAEVTDQ